MEDGTPAIRRRSPRAARQDMRWLEQRSRTFYAVMDVPRPLRAAVGKKRLVRSLETRDYHVALAKRHAALAEFQRVFMVTRSRVTPSPIVEAGLAYRDMFARIDRGDAAAIAQFQGGPEIAETGPYDPAPTPRQIARAIAEMSFHDHLDALGHGEGRYEDARTLAGIATSQATPLRLYIEAWLSEGGQKGPLNERTKGQYRADMLALEDWAKSAGVAPLIEAFTRITAGRYVTEQLLGRGVDRGTANRKISAASAYWRWLIKRGHATDSPWTGQSLTKTRVGRAVETPKRPFTEAEVATLFSGDAGSELADVMWVAALSGMRIEEIYRLTVSACVNGWFDLRRSKTPAGQRRVPIHSALLAVIERRTKDKLPIDFLFHEPGAERPGRERSMAVSKRFGKYRQRLGVHEAVAGRRQSRIDFHSFRRWFITKARVRYDRAVVAAIVGHEVGNITDDVYSGGPDDGVRRACVESVQLPEWPVHVAAPV